MNLRSLVPFRERGNIANVTRPETNLFDSLHREVDRLFDDFTRGLVPFAVAGNGNLLPSIDVSETDKQIEITVEMPGLERKDVDISVNNNNTLVIRGEKKIEADKDDKKKNYHVTERAYGVFYRAFELPAGVDPSKIQATMSNGVLKITVPKPAQSEAKKIEVKEAA